MDPRSNPPDTRIDNRSDNRQISDNRPLPADSRPVQPDNRLDTRIDNRLDNRLDNRPIQTDNRLDNRPIQTDNRPDNRPNHLHELFSRGSTPPGQPYAASHLSSNSSPTQIDSLFHNLSAPPDKQHLQSHTAVQPSEGFHSSAPVTPVISTSDDPIPSSTSATTASERQSALLSLLGAPPTSTTNNVRPPAGAGPPLTQQVPTPPGPSQRSAPSPTHNETQGKILLEQLMSG